MATITVTTFADELDAGATQDADLSLREALEIARTQAGADTIVFAASLGAGTVLLNSPLEGRGGNLFIDTDVTIDGGGDVTIDGRDQTRIFYIDEGADATLRGLTLQNGSARGTDGGDGSGSGSGGGGGLGAGGAVFVAGGATLRIDDVAFGGSETNGNGAFGGGGGDGSRNFQTAVSRVRGGDGGVGFGGPAFASAAPGGYYNSSSSNYAYDAGADGGFGGGGGGGKSGGYYGGFGGGGGGEIGGYNGRVPGGAFGGDGGEGASFVEGEGDYAYYARSSGGGGGGAGLGGSIFVQEGGAVVFAGNVSFSGGRAGGGAGGGGGDFAEDGQGGQGVGSALFLLQSVTFEVASGEVTTVADAIADDGDAGLVKTGAGTLVLAGANTYTSATTVGDGVLQVDGSIAGSAVTVAAGASLTGGGTTGALSVAGVLSVGGTAAPIADLATGALSLTSGATLRLDAIGDAAGQYDQLLVTGAVAFGGADFALAVTNDAALAVGDVLTLIVNDGDDAVSGMFAGLAEGGTFTESGIGFRLSYLGGTGNDVTLTVTAVAIRGDDGDNRLLGTAAGETIEGFGGNDRLDGRGGADSLFGGTGEDVYIVDSADDEVLGEAAGAELDTVRTQVSYSLEDAANVESLVATSPGSTTGLTLTGNELDNFIRATAGGDVLDGGDGADRLFGLGGDDRLLGGDGGDSLSGEAGDDTLAGGLGRDTLYGGAGADRFVFDSVDESGPGIASRDKIFDFRQGDGDMIDLRGIDAIAGGQDDDFTVVARFTGEEGQLRLLVRGGVTVVQGDVDGDGESDLEITVYTTETLRADDFLL